jgi:hypothetical protein
VVKEVVWKKLVTLGLLLHLLNYLGCLWRTCSRAPAVVTKEYEWSLGGITEDTYVTLTYTNPDGTTGGLSDYYGALGSQYIFCARQKHSYSEPWYHNLNGRRSTSLHLHQHQHQHLSLSLSLHQLLEEH